MRFSEFKQRFETALLDFAHNRRIKDYGAAMAATTVQGLTKDGFWSTPVVHAVLLAYAFPETKIDAIRHAYKEFVPWYDRLWYRFLQWHESLADHPDPLPLPPLRSRD